MNKYLEEREVFEIAMLRQEPLNLERGAGKMTRKRFVKLLMAKGVERNDANRIAQEFRKGHWPYEFAWIALEWRLEK